MRLIAELGSCHMGRKDRLLEAISAAKAFNIELKLQLFENNEKNCGTGNVHLSEEHFLLAWEYAAKIGTKLSASIFDDYYFDFLWQFKPSFIKLAYSKKDQIKWIERCLGAGIEPIVSCDVLSESKIPKEATKLYCIPEYPVRYKVCFNELFPRFQGFSDHTMGLSQTYVAMNAGAKIIEKHVKLGYDDEVCPDAQFAVLIEDFGGIERK